MKPKTPKPLFDLVAPIAIYHGADVLYKRKAQAAIRQLQARWADRYPATTADDWREYLEYAEPARLPNILDFYKELFRASVAEEQPGWTEFVDRWGAYGYKDESGQVVFSGDSGFQFPWYETEALLRERCQDHELAGVCTE
jgi:hypothetical protein